MFGLFYDKAKPYSDLKLRRCEKGKSYHDIVVHKKAIKICNTMHPTQDLTTLGNIT